MQADMELDRTLKTIKLLIVQENYRAAHHSNDLSLSCKKMSTQEKPLPSQLLMAGG
jgi:hypothetical protein